VSESLYSTASIALWQPATAVGDVVTKINSGDIVAELDYRLILPRLQIAMAQSIFSIYLYWSKIALKGLDNKHR
jgi:hypothetical protein